MKMMMMATALILLLRSPMLSQGAVQMIFGDSLVDVGNNNRLTRSLARPALPWYGVDFGNHLPNGRFTNGRTVADLIGDKMGLPRPPAFLDPTLNVDVILQSGLNFASGGAGILNDTASFFIQRLSLYRQIELFQGAQRLVAMKIGEAAASKFFMEARYVIVIGSNDLINNYLLPLSSSSWTYDAASFVIHLITTLDSQLRLLHNLGARELYLVGVGPMGCIPLQRFMTLSGACQVETNALSQAFNKAAGELVGALAHELPDAAFQFGDPYNVVLDLIENPNAYGFDNSASPCCSLGIIRPSLTCTPLSTLCVNRSQYVFWDEYHPTERANEFIAGELAVQLGLGSVNASSPSGSQSLV